MFYRPENGHGLPRNPFNAIVAPRPIAWVATTGPKGDNLAPYSFFNAVAYTPPQVVFAPNGQTDSLLNIRDTGVFSISIVGEEMLDRMNATSAEVPREVDEFAMAGVEKLSCETIACPRVGGAPAALECRATREIALEGKDNFLIIGTVTGIHIRDDVLRDGLIDPHLSRPLARLGYRDYALLRAVHTLKRPGDK